jgi:hypothetical protein
MLLQMGQTSVFLLNSTVYTYIHRRQIEGDKNKKQDEKKKKTYNSWDSLVVTHPTTNQPACGLSMAERTGSPVFHTLWSYVLDRRREWIIS